MYAKYPIYVVNKHCMSLELLVNSAVNRDLIDQVQPKTFLMTPYPSQNCYVPHQKWFDTEYRLGPGNSKWFIGKVFLWIKWKFELNYNL